jgi:hypothetical protein
MTLLFTMLVLSPLCADQSLTLFKVDRAMKFFIPLEFKKTPIPCLVTNLALFYDVHSRLFFVTLLLWNDLY